MRHWKVLFALLAAAPLAGVEQGGRGLCTNDTTVPGLPKAVCYFPSCPAGADCLPPSVEKTSATIEYLEPLLRWQDSCPNKQIVGACWEVYLDFRFRLAANDPAGVSHIGVNLMSEVNARRTFQLHWGKAHQKDSLGRYEMTGGMVAHVPPGQRLELGVFELCARDLSQNEGCMLPPKGNALAFRLGR